MRTSILLRALALSICLETAILAQFKEGPPEGVKLGESLTQRYQAGLIVTAANGACQGIVAAVPVPIDWPEQVVRIAEEEIPPTARVTYQMVEGTVKQMLVQVPFLPYGEQCRVVVTFEVTRNSQLPPENTDIYELPDKRRLARDVRPYLATSPFIESTNAKIRALAKEVGADQEKAWDKVEAIYDWVRENVEYKDGDLKGALAALNDGTGDCEELSSLFIAICRAAGIPARTVWVPGHCYPEFYLVDDEGKGHWFPCQAAGSRAFGGIPEHRPILQKGDNFRSPDNPRERKRYLAEKLKVANAAGKPQVKFVRDLVSN